MGNGVANRVPESADLTPAYSTEPDEPSLNASENERQRADHNPRVGGSSPSSGIAKGPAVPVLRSRAPNRPSRSRTTLTTTWPCSSAGPSGSELSHSAAP